MIRDARLQSRGSGVIAIGPRAHRASGDATRPDRRTSFSILVSSMPGIWRGKHRSETIEPLGREPFPLSASYGFP
jgi:hypothetical protein